MPDRSRKGGWQALLVLLVVLLVLGVGLRSQGCHYNVHFANRISCE